MINWNFPGNNYGQITGISEAGIETFKGLPIASLAREVCQNSLDAINDIDKPVYMEFEKIEVNNEKIPGFEKLKESIEKCYDYGIEQNNNKTIKFFKKAVDSIKTNVNVLRISDYNTKGLLGSEKENENSPWRNLVKSNGVSDKEGSSGGSFGIGKSASFACSKIRTIFYRTLDKDGITAAQGISKLISFRKEKDITGDMTNGTGYYGEVERNSAVTNIELLDEMNIRDKVGTDIFIYAFDGEDTWQSDIITELLESFLLSFYKGVLEVKVGDILINKENLEFLINKYPVNYAESYYKVLTDPETLEVSDDFEGMGKLILKVLLKDDLNRKVLISRSNGMKLFDKDRISGSIQFSAILLMEGEELNKYFRIMESPQHNKWEPERYEEKKSEAKSNTTKLYRWIKEKIRDLAVGGNEEEIDAEGVGELIPDLIDNTNNKSSEKEESITDDIKDWEFKMSQKKTSKKNDIDEDFGEDNDIVEKGDFDDDGIYEGMYEPGEGKNNGNNGDVNTGKAKPGDGNVQILGYKEAKKYKMRLFLSDRLKRKYTLTLKPQKDYANCYIEIKIAGEQSNIKDINILNARFNDKHDLECRGNIIYLYKIKHNEKNIIVFNLDDEDIYSLEVKLYES